MRTAIASDSTIAFATLLRQQEWQTLAYSTAGKLLRLLQTKARPARQWEHLLGWLKPDLGLSKPAADAEARAALPPMHHRLATSSPVTLRQVRCRFAPSTRAAGLAEVRDRLAASPKRGLH